MDSVFKYDRVILVKELNDDFKKVGEVFEIANVYENYFLLRDGFTRVAIGVVSFEDFERCFVKEESFNNTWTSWTPIIGIDGQCDVLYKTNRKRVKVKFLKDNIVSEACCCKDDEFNLWFGIQLAYYRCKKKSLSILKKELEKELSKINEDMSNNNNVIKRIVQSLEK